MKKTEIIVLAAGKGTRMHSRIPKVLQKIGGKSILYWIIELIKKSGFSSANFVLGYQYEEIINELNKLEFDYKKIIQKKLNGTAKSLEKGLSLLNNRTENVLVLFGDDAGLYKPETITDFIQYHAENKNKATFMVLDDDRVSDIGGLEIDSNMNIIGVKTMSQIRSNNNLKHFILCGAFCFDKDWIQKSVSQISLNPRSGEFPLPQIIEVAKSQEINVKGFLLKDINEWESVNTKEGLKTADIKKKFNKYGK